MRDFTFVTGNQNKADRLAKHLGVPIKHRKVSLDEIQSLDPQAIAEHKVRQAYAQVNSPVLIEDTSVVFHALGRLPGPFIRFFLEEMPYEALCSLLDGKDRSATARTTFCYFDGTAPVFFEGKLEGRIAEKPSAKEGWEWDMFFIPAGESVPRSEADAASYHKTSLMLRPYEEVRKFLLEG